MADNTAKLNVGGNDHESRRSSTASIGPSVVNISSFYKDTGMFTYDPGFHLNRFLRIQDHLYRR